MPPSSAAVAGDGHAGAHVDAPLLERAQDDLGDVLVAAGQDLRQRLEDRDLGAEVAHHRRELAADGAAADDRRRSRAARSIDRNSSEVRTIVPSTSKPGMVRGTEPEARMTCVAVELDVARVAAGDRAPTGRRAGVPVPVEHGDLAALEQAARPSNSWSTTCCLRAWVTEKSSVGSPASMPKSAGRRWCGARAPSRAAPWPGCSRRAGRCRRPCPSRPGRREPGRGAVERRGVAARTAADDDDVELLGRGDHLLGEGRSGVRTLRPGPGPVRAARRDRPATAGPGAVLVHRRGQPTDLDDGVACAGAPPREDAPHRRDVVVVAPVADLDVALADRLRVGGVEGQPARTRDGGLEPGVGLHAHSSSSTSGSAPVESSSDAVKR